MEIYKNATVLIARDHTVLKILKKLFKTLNNHVYVDSLAAKVSSGQQLFCMENHCLRGLRKQNMS